MITVPFLTGVDFEALGSVRSGGFFIFGAKIFTKKQPFEEEINQGLSLIPLPKKLNQGPKPSNFFPFLNIKMGGFEDVMFERSGVWEDLFGIMMSRSSRQLILRRQVSIVRNIIFGKNLF